MSLEKYPVGWKEFVSALKLRGGNSPKALAVWAAKFRIQIFECEHLGWNV